MVAHSQPGKITFSQYLSPEIVSGTLDAAETFAVNLYSAISAINVDTLIYLGVFCRCSSVVQLIFKQFD